MSDLNKEVTLPAEERQMHRFLTAYQKNFGKSVDLYYKLDKIYRRMNPVSEKGTKFFVKVYKTKRHLKARLKSINTRMYYEFFPDNN